MKLWHCVYPILITVCFLTSPWAQENRSIDGKGNNLNNPEWGSTNGPIMHFVQNGFADGISEPGGSGRPSPRSISNALFDQEGLWNDGRGLSALVWGWGQFIDHDITLSPDSKDPEENFPIVVPYNDAYFDPNGTGRVRIPMQRSEYMAGTGNGTARRYFNGITAYIDASAVYGSDEERAAWLRTFDGGQLKTSFDDLLPFNTVDGRHSGEIDSNHPPMAMPFAGENKFFVAGDVRANENPLLISLHTIFVREHNRLAYQIAFEQGGSEEEIYQHARRLVAGMLQAITYEEWLPTLGIHLDPYEGYDETVDPSIMNVFNTAAYRYGHTTINSWIVMKHDNSGSNFNEKMRLRSVFFNPIFVSSLRTIEPILYGMAQMVEQDFDCKVIDELRHFLFAKPGQGGLDLVALNINRGRERGLPDYNTVREDFGLPKVTRFSEITADVHSSTALRLVYKSLDNIDPWVGMLAEDHMPDALFGETAMTIIRKQFEALRDGDRFFYLNDKGLSQEEINFIHSTRLVDVIERNTGLQFENREIFRTQNLTTGLNPPLVRYQKQFQVSPNPARERIRLDFEFEGEEEATVLITDLAGREALKFELNDLKAGFVDVNLPPEMAEGLYLVNLFIGEKVGIQQLIKN